MNPVLKLRSRRPGPLPEHQSSPVRINYSEGGYPLGLSRLVFRFGNVDRPWAVWNPAESTSARSLPLEKLQGVPQSVVSLIEVPR